MRGEDRVSRVLFSYADLEARVPAEHPLRAMRDLVNASLVAMDPSFYALYKAEGRPSIPPEPLSATPAAASQGEVQHGSNLSGNYRPLRVSSQCNSTDVAIPRRSPEIRAHAIK